MKLKTKLWFILRWLIWIKDNLLDNPEINSDILPFSIWKDSWDNEIPCYKFWTWKEKILYFGWIHWNEVWTVKLMNKWVNYLWNKVGDENFHPLQNKTIFIIPCLNIFWYKKALEKPNYFAWWNIWKTNFNNVDLNRNFPSSNWSAKTKLFVSWKYYDISGWEKAWGEKEVEELVKFIKKENIKDIYTYHNCRGTVMWTISDKARLMAKQYSYDSWYRVFSEEEWSHLKDEQKTWHSMVYWDEQKLNIVEIELKTRWGSEWNTNKKALENSLKL